MSQDFEKPMLSWIKVCLFTVKHPPSFRAVPSLCMSKPHATNLWECFSSTVQRMSSDQRGRSAHQMFHRGVLLFAHHLCKQLSLNGCRRGFIGRSSPIHVCAFAVWMYHCARASFWTCTSVWFCVYIFVRVCVCVLSLRLLSSHFTAAHQQRAG